MRLMLKLIINKPVKRRMMLMLWLMRCPEGLIGLED